MSTAQQPTISIITPAYNAAATIGATIKRITQQQYPNIEYIIIDGGSTDGTQKVIKMHQQHIAYWVSEPDKGIYNAMNKGIAKAKGEIIGIINADDCYLPNTLALVATAFTENPQADIVHGNLYKFREFDDRCIFRKATPQPERLKETMSIFHPTCFVKKGVYDDLGVFDERYKVSADYEFLLRAFLAGKQFHHINKPLACFRVGGESNTNCTSYEEAYQIHQHYKTGYANNMLQLEKQCKRKLKQKKIISTLANMLGMGKYLEKRIMQKWKDSAGGNK